MADIRPFKGFRPAKDKAHLVPIRSVDNYQKDQLRHKLQSNPFSFLQIINPDFADGKRTRPGSAERLRKIKNRYNQFIKEEILVQDEVPSYYLYQQIKGGNIYTGIIGRSSVEDYENGTIKIHEHTLTERELKLKEYLEICDFNAEPVLFSYENLPPVDDMVNLIMLNEPEWDFSTTDRARHKLWLINKPEQVETLQHEFKKLNAIYIADGHHRSASSAKLSSDRKKQNKNHTGQENYNFYLGIFFSQNQLKIYDFNRLVTDTNNLNADELLEQLKKNFKIINHRETIYKPEHPHKFSMYLQENWYELIPKAEIIDLSNPVKKLDVSILSDFVLEPVLGIADLKTDKRIGFVNGTRGPEEMKRLVDDGKYKIAFGLFPISMSELKNIADNNCIMPPKSTWVEPKIRTGLVVYSLEENN